MTSALKSILGFAKQTAAGTPGSTFKYLLYNTAFCRPEQRDPASGYRDRRKRAYGALDGQDWRVRRRWG